MIGMEIKALREDANMTRRDLALAIESSEAAIVNVENGRENFSENYIKRIEEVFGLQPMTLLQIPKNTIERKEENKIVGRNIRKIRNQRGLTQCALSEILGYSGPGAISFVESGTRGIGRDRLLKFCRAMDVHISDVLYSSKDDCGQCDEDPLLEDFLLLFHAKTPPPTFDAIADLIHITAGQLRS